MRDSIAKALKDLDGLGEKAVRTRILGIQDEDEAEEPSEETETPGEESDEEELDADTKKKLEELLSQE